MMLVFQRGHPPPWTGQAKGSKLELEMLSVTTTLARAEEAIARKRPVPWALVAWVAFLLQNEVVSLARSDSCGAQLRGPWQRGQGVWVAGFTLGLRQ